MSEIEFIDEIDASFRPPSDRDLDRKPIRVDRPDGKSIVMGYDVAGRLSTVSTPDGVSTLAYDAVTGDVASVTAPGGEGVSFAYDGSLVTGVAWTGTVSGSVSLGYDDNFRLTSQSGTVATRRPSRTTAMGCSPVQGR